MSSNSFSFNMNNFTKYSIKEKYETMKEEEIQPFVLKNFLVTLETRKNIINWIIFLCKNLNFTNQTLFHTISIFDQYLSKISKESMKYYLQN